MNDFDTELALKLSKIVHEKCKEVPHDIGILLAREVYSHNLAEYAKIELEQAQKMDKFFQENKQIFKDFFKPKNEE